MRVLDNTSARAAFFAYHSVSTARIPFLAVTPDAFESHLVALRRHGWQTGDEATLARLARGEATGRPTAFLTFDDGYVDNHQVVLPLLRRYRCRAFMFVLPDLLDEGSPIAWEGVEQAAADHPDVMRSMTWAMVEELAEHGNAVGSHTNHHPRLCSLSDEELCQELLDSRRRISERLGACDSLAYPYGEEDSRVRAAAQAAGYRWAFTMPRGRPRRPSPLAIPRVAVDHRDDERRFTLKLHPLTRRVMHSDLRIASQGALATAYRQVTRLGSR